MALRNRDEPLPRFSEAERLVLRQSAAIDQALALVQQAMRANAANRPLVDLALDVQLALRAART